MKRDQESFESHLSYISSVVAKHGPDPDEYDQHLAWYTHLNRQIQNGDLTEQQQDQLREAFGAAYSCETLQGFVYQRPLGYAGDYQIIEKIYNCDISDDPKLRKYDEFFQSRKSPQAVRNRKDYFKKLIHQLASERRGTLQVLNLASGPCREIKELFDESPSLPVAFRCIDIDERAIRYASELLGRYVSNVVFERANILRFKPPTSYSLIWSAGLFDYFDDRTFARILQRYIPALLPGGRIAIGNFSTANPSRGYMEAIARWQLYHRSDEQLEDLAKSAVGELDCQIHVESEPTGVNRFLHIGRQVSGIRLDSGHPKLKGMTRRATKPAAEQQRESK